MAQPLEPPWYGPVCPVVWEGRSREASPYPDQSVVAITRYAQWTAAIAATRGVIQIDAYSG